MALVSVVGYSADRGWGSGYRPAVPASTPSSSDLDGSTGRVCVFCGSAPGTDPAHLELARGFGAAVAGAGLGLVYGGATVGLMGAVADAALAGGGEVVGVIPEALRDREIAHPGLTELLVVADMHERKKAMYERADGFVALPGGLGTFEEVFEAATWTQLGLHGGATPKPVVLLDPGDFWDPLVAFLDRAVDAGFVKAHNRPIIGRASSAADAISLVAAAGNS